MTNKPVSLGQALNTMLMLWNWVALFAGILPWYLVLIACLYLSVVRANLEYL